MKTVIDRSKEITLMRGEVYDKMIELLKEGGWEDIASNPATEFNIMYSKGESGTNNLYVQLMPWCKHSSLIINPDVGYQLNAIAQVNSNGTNVHDYGSIFTVRILKEYKSTQPGNNGLFARDDKIFGHNIFFDNQSPTTPNYRLTYYVDKDRFLFVVRPWKSFNGWASIIGVGLPEKGYRSDLNGMRDLIFFSNFLTDPSLLYWNSSYNNPVYQAQNYNWGVNKCVCVDFPESYGDAENVIDPELIVNNMFVANPNYDDVYITSPIHYGSRTFGKLGELFGIRLMFQDSIDYDKNIIKNGDVLDDSSGEKYITVMNNVFYYKHNYFITGSSSYYQYSPNTTDIVKAQMIRNPSILLVRCI